MKIEQKPKKGALFFISGLCGFLLIATVGLLLSSGDLASESSAMSVRTIDRIISTYPKDNSEINLNTVDRNSLENAINQAISLLKSEIVSFKTIETKKVFELGELQHDELNIGDVPGLQSRLSESREFLKSRLSIRKNLATSYRVKKKQCRKFRGEERRSCNLVANEIKESIKENNSFISEIRKNIRDLNKQIRKAKRNKVDNSSDTERLEKEIEDLRYQIINHNNRIEDLQNIKSRLGNSGDDTVLGCTDPVADNFNPDAVEYDGSCVYENQKSGCINPGALNYDTEATVNDGSCEYAGCTDSTAMNYDRAATEDDGSCQYDEVCECSEGTAVGEEYPGFDLGEVRKVTVNITEYGGPNDSVMKKDEKVSITGELARNLNPNDIYTAWPISTGEKALDLNLQSCLAPDSKDGSLEGEGAVNNSLRDSLDVEISYTDEKGVKRTVVARANDRGPGDPGRWDASRGLWSALGLEDVLDGDPNDPDQAVELEIRVIPRAKSCANNS